MLNFTFALSSAMNNLKFDGIIALAIFLITISNVAVLGMGSSAFLVMDEDQPSSRCKYSKAFSMLQVDCTKKDLENIPDNLNTGIEVKSKHNLILLFIQIHKVYLIFKSRDLQIVKLKKISRFLYISIFFQVMVMTFNRITELHENSFSPYGSLAFLYLDKNFISELGDSVKNLPYLQVLDVSKNVHLKTLPPALFELPYLRKLYLTKNSLKDDTFEVEISSPLEYLEVAENQLTKIPSIGPQTKLTYLNLSENHIEHISVEDISLFCSLKTLDLTKNPIKFSSSSCDCHHFNSWIKKHNINVTPHYYCNNDTLLTCSRNEFSNKTIESFKRCSELIEIQEARIRAKSTWIIIACCIGAFLICLLIGLYFVHKRNKKRHADKKNEQRLSIQNAKTELLNRNLPEQENTKS